MVEATGRPPVLSENIKSVRQSGHVILLGLPHGPSGPDMTEFFRQVFLNWITVTGALERNRVLTPTEYLKHSYIPEVNYLIGLLETGKLKTAGLVSHLIQPTRVQERVRRLDGAVPRRWAADQRLHGRSRGLD